jgi:hypothetical protein
VSNAQRELLLAPSAADGVNVTAANTAGLDLDVDICVVLELHVNLAYYFEAYRNHRRASACTASAKDAWSAIDYHQISRNRRLTKRFLNSV